MKGWVCFFLTLKNPVYYVGWVWRGGFLSCLELLLKPVSFCTLLQSTKESYTGKEKCVSLRFELCIDTIWVKVCGFSKGVWEDKQVRQWGLPFSFLEALPPRIVDCPASNNQQTIAYGFILQQHASPKTQFSQVAMPVTSAHSAICCQRGERSMCLSYNPPPTRCPPCLLFAR